MTDTRCPEALYGQHGEPTTGGRCPYCGAALRARGTGAGRPYRPGGQDTLEERRAARMMDQWGHRGVPADQYDPDTENLYYEE